MKKTAYVILLSIMLATCLLGLFACGEEDGKTDDKTVEHTHKYIETVVEPNCTEKGYTLHACDCGESYKDNYIGELRHEFTNYVGDNNANYEKDGTKTATCNHGCGEKDTIADIGTKLVSGLTFKTLTLNSDNTVYGKVANGTSTFSFLNEITINGSATYTVSTDIYGQQVIPSKTVELNAIENTFYVLADNTENGLVLYTVTIRVKQMYTVEFDTLGGSEISNQSIEEDSFAITPADPNKTGYTFQGWNYNFNTPITSAITITANSWQANSYIVSFDGNGVTNPEDITVTYDSTYGKLPVLQERTGYVFKGWWTEKENGTEIKVDTQVSILDNQTLYAHWVTDVKYFLSSDSTYYTVGGVNSNKKEIVIFDTFNDIPVLSIGDRAFLSCVNIENIVIPNSIESIGETAFGNCLKLKTITIPSKVEVLSKSMFYDCENLESITILGNITTIGDNCFERCYKLKDFNIPSSVKSIGKWAFANCDSLESLFIPNSVEFVGGAAFFSCERLTSIVFENTADWYQKVGSEWFPLSVVNSTNIATSWSSNSISPEIYKNKTI